MSIKKYTIVIVEDDAMLQKYLAASFKKDPQFEVHTASNGEEGEELIKRVLPSLVLLDVIMPKKNGFEVLEAIRADQATKQIPVIILSNLGQQKDIDHATALGANGYLVKVDMQVSEIVSKAREFLQAPSL